MTVAAGPGGEILAPYLGGQLTALRRRICASNRPGDLDGLCARHILGDGAGIQWDVNPITESWLADHADRLDDAGPLAAVGYGLSTTTAAGLDISPQVRAALARFMQRDHLRISGPTFLHDARILLGVALAALAVRPEMPEASAWLARTLTDPRLKLADRFHELMRQHVLATITERAPDPILLDSLIHPGELALGFWMVGQNTARLVDPADQRVLSERVMRAVIQVDSADVTVTQAALLSSSANGIANTSIDQALLNRAHLSLVLSRFPAAMRRWRWDDGNRVKEPIRWPITSEREIQDILWLVLRSVFDDVIDEETNPKVGHASTRADFGIPSLRLLVEVKYVYDGTAAEFKKIEQEAMVDSVAYLQRATLYDQIVVFVYDASASVERHDLARRTLRQVPGIADVVIVSRPGVLSASPTGATGIARRKAASASARNTAATNRAPDVNKAAPRTTAATGSTAADAAGG